MRPSAMFRVRGIAALLTLSTAITLSAPPASAADAKAAGRASAQTSLAAATAAHLAVLAPAPAAFEQAPAAEASATSTESRPFFRTRTGVVALVLMVAGAGYVAYSIPKDNEKVHSPIR